MIKTSGVYEIVNTANGHRYFGSAVDINGRWRVHKSELRRGLHRNRYLQNAWIKYGEDSFSFSVLRVVENKRDLLLHEQDFINALNPEYNLARVAGSRIGISHSNETKQKISKANSGKKRTQLVCSEMSLQRIGRKHDERTKAKISESKKGKRNSFYGKTHSIETRKKMSESGKRNIGSVRPGAKIVYQYSASMELIGVYDSTGVAAIKLNLDQANIAGCCRGKQKTSGGFIWRYTRSE
jgi:group I intron endonuclease